MSAAPYGVEVADLRVVEARRKLDPGFADLMRRTFPGQRYVATSPHGWLAFDAFDELLAFLLAETPNIAAMSLLLDDADLQRAVDALGATYPGPLDS